MNYETMKTAAEATLAGVKIEFNTEDGKALKSVLVTDAAGNSLLIKGSGGYSDTLVVMRPQNYEVQTRHVVKADLPGGIKIREIFSDGDAADKRLSEIRDGQGLGYSDKSVKIEDVDVRVAPDGKIIGVHGKAAPELVDDLPF